MQTLINLLALFVLISYVTACSFGVPIGSSKQSSTHKKPTKPNSYIVFGKQYTILDSSEGYVKRGIASWYGKKFHGRKTSNGETYDMFAMTAAHKTLPLPAKVSVKNLSNGKTIIVRVNDRGPFVGDRLIDLSYAAAKKLDMIKKGTARVEIRVIDDTNSTPVVRTIPLKDSEAPTADFFIQLGSFGLRKNALSLIEQLKINQFSDAKIYSIETQKGTFHRVRMGPYSLLEKTNTILKQLHKKQFKQARLVVEN